ASHYKIASHMDPATRRLLDGPIAPTLLRLAAPNVVMLVAQVAISILEAYFVGWLGADALAGVSVTFPLVMLMQTMSAGGMGGGARLLERDLRRRRRGLALQHARERGPRHRQHAAAGRRRAGREPVSREPLPRPHLRLGAVSAHGCHGRRPRGGGVLRRRRARALRVPRLRAQPDPALAAAPLRAEPACRDLARRGAAPGQLR